MLISSTLTAQISLGGFNVYYGHLHNHSNVSDGTGTPDAAYNYAKNTAHLDFFSLADHSGSIDATEWTAMKTAADKYNEPGVFSAFRGFEWTSSGSYGHLAVINSSDYCTTASPTNTFATFCDWLTTRECVVFFNHPGRENAGGIEFSHFSTTPSSKIVGMELWNKSDAFSDYYYNDGYYSNDGNKGYYDEALIRNWKIGASGSEDNHVGTWGTYNNYRLAVLAYANTRDEIYNAFKARRFFSTLDKNLALSFKINGNEMGSTVLPGTYGINIQASDGDGEIFTQVQLFNNGTVVNTWMPNSASPNITMDLSFANNEYYYIRVKQVDGDEAISSPIWIYDGNLPPVVSLTSPAANEVYLAPASITIAANATDTDGTITKIRFYEGTTLLGEDMTSPYSFTWSNVQSGTYSITANATDNSGASTISAPVGIKVVNSGDPVITSSVIATGLDDVEESAAGIIYTNSTDIELVYDSYNSAGNQKVGLRFTNLAIPQNAIISNAYIQFTCDEVTTGVCSLVIKGEATDNSSSFTTTANNVSARTMTTASVNWAPPAWSTADIATLNQRTPDISSVIQEIVNRSGYTSSSAISIILTGSGTRTAEAYEGVPASAAKLFVTYTLPVLNKPPVVSIISPGNGSQYSAPATITLTASATDSDGSIAKVDFFNGSTLIGTDNSSPYSITWNNVVAGNYTLIATAYDNAGSSTVSSPIVVTVVAPNQPPIVTITSPVSGTTFTAPASVLITASASDADGTIAKVDFYQGSTLIGSDNTGPYTYTLSNLPAGSYTFIANATDNVGSNTASAQVNIIVNSAPATYTFTKRIESSSDDVEETATGTVSLNSDDIELVYDTWTTGNQIVGLRFNGVTVPKGATVTSAFIQFTVDEISTGTCKLTIKGENADNAQAFGTARKNVSGRSRTSASVSWNPANWTTTGAAGTAQRTADLKGIVQEIINRAAWSSSNSMVFIISGSGKRTAEAYNESPSKAALLTIVYTIPGIVKSGIQEAPTIETTVKAENLICCPVPFTNQLHIEFIPVEGENIIAFELFNSTGSRIKNSLSVENHIVMELPDLFPGIYVVRVRSNKGLYSKIVIKK
jgi:hypothetical protein